MYANTANSYLYWPYLNVPSLSPFPEKSNLRLDSWQLLASAVASRTSSSLFLEDM